MKKRNTWQKEVILDTLQSNRIHPTIDELYEIIKKEHNIGKATVYRNINEMVHEGKIRKISSSDAYHYDVDVSNHYHLICKECKHIIDIFDADIDNLINKTKNNQDIIIDQVHIIIEGVCSLCKNKRERR